MRWQRISVGSLVATLSVCAAVVIASSDSDSAATPALVKTVGKATPNRTLNTQRPTTTSTTSMLRALPSSSATPSAAAQLPAPGVAASGSATPQPQPSCPLPVWLPPVPPLPQPQPSCPLPVWLPPGRRPPTRQRLSFWLGLWPVRQSCLECPLTGTRRDPDPAQLGVAARAQDRNCEHLHGLEISRCRSTRLRR